MQSENRKEKKVKNDSFCVFVISHGRPGNVITLKTLKKAGYSGPCFIVCDNEDETVDQYRKKHGEEKVVVFDKMLYAEMVDSCDNFQDRRTTTHARNACFDIAKEKGFDFFLVLDDDYQSIYLLKESDKNTTDRPVENCLQTFQAVCKWLKNVEQIKSVCFMQTGDAIGGMKSVQKLFSRFPFLKRKAMNSFFCKTDRRFWFFSRLNEDVNTYLEGGKRGEVFLTIPDALIKQKQTQKTKGGMSEAYLANGTYVKSFYTVMICPSFAKVTITPAMSRLHHRIAWDNAIPKIINEDHRKP